MLPIENTFIMVPDKYGYDRWKTMENLQLGEEVYTYDIKTGTIGIEKITSILMHPYYHYAHKNLYEVNGIIGTENQKYVSIPGVKTVIKNGNEIPAGSLIPIEELKLVLYVLGMQQLVVRVDDGRYGIYIETIKELNKPLYHYLKNLVHLITEYNEKPVITYDYKNDNTILYLTFLQDKYSDIDFTERLNLTSEYLIDNGSTVVDVLLSVSKSLIGETYIKTKTYTEAQNIQDLCILSDFGKGSISINGTSSGTPWNSVIYYSQKFECYIIKFLDNTEIENKNNLQLTSVVPLDLTEKYEGKYFGVIGLNYGDTKKLIVKQLFYCNDNNGKNIISESDIMILE